MYSGWSGIFLQRKTTFATKSHQLLKSMIRFINGISFIHRIIESNDFIM